MEVNLIHMFQEVFIKELFSETNFGQQASESTTDIVQSSDLMQFSYEFYYSRLNVIHFHSSVSLK